MSPIIPRAYPRTAFETPIKYRLPGAGQYHAARTSNYSMGGLCLKTDRQLPPQSEICVVMENYAPGKSGPERYRSYIASVRWIRPQAPRRPDRFIAGTQIMACSHEILTADDRGLCRVCDLCGALIQECLLHGTEDKAQLCEPCHGHYDNIPEGPISECVERFLIGNVV
jgi:hypothetical protein